MSILIVTGIEGARNCAEVVGKQLRMEVEVAEGCKTALKALRRREYATVIVDETLAECDPAGADAIWERAGLAIPLQINFALAGAARLVREIRAALNRREREQFIARRAAASTVETEVRTAITALLLHSQLAMADADIPAQAADKLRVVAAIANDLRQQLSASSKDAACTAA